MNNHSNSIPWAPGHLLTDGYRNIYMDPVAFMFEPDDHRYMAIVSLVDEIIEDMIATSEWWLEEGQ